MAPLLNAQVIGKEFIPLSVSQFSSSIARIQQAKPDWLMMYITGQNHSNYYPQANAAGIKIPMGSSINIAQGYEHRRFKPPALARFHVTASYMEEIPTPRNRKFVAAVARRCFPTSPTWPWKATARTSRPTSMRRRCASPAPPRQGDRY